MRSSRGPPLMSLYWKESRNGGFNPFPAPGILIAWPPTFLESSAFSLGFERPRRTGRDASSAEVHGPRELASRLPPPFEVLIGRKEEPDDAAKA